MVCVLLLHLRIIIENYPGFPEGVSGAELADRFRQHALNAGEKKEQYFVLHGYDTYTAKAVILAMGIDYSFALRNKVVAVVGGGSSQR